MISTVRWVGAAMVAACLAASLSSSAPLADPPQPVQPPLYLALGDSVAAGVGADTVENGYVSLLHDTLSGCDPGRDCRLDLLNLAESGATTTSLIGGRSGQRQPSQLAEAVALLDAHDNVRLVTLDIGGNDLFWPVVDACAANPETPRCHATIVEQLQLVAANYDLILGRLRAAAGPGTTITVMAYYNPLPACRLSPLSGLAELVLDGAEPQSGLNDIIRAAAAKHGAVVVETAQIIAPRDLVDDCLHPNNAGHADIAAAFAKAVGNARR